MLLPDGDDVEAIAPSHVPLMDFFWELLPKCCHTHAPTHGIGSSRKLSNIPSRRPMIVLPILVGTSGNVAAGTHMPASLPASTRALRGARAGSLHSHNLPGKSPRPRSRASLVRWWPLQPVLCGLEMSARELIGKRRCVASQAASLSVCRAADAEAVCSAMSLSHHHVAARAAAR